MNIDESSDIISNVKWNHKNHNLHTNMLSNEKCNYTQCNYQAKTGSQIVWSKNPIVYSNEAIYILSNEK